MVLVLVVAYLVSSRRYARTHEVPKRDRRKRVWFGLGVAVLWLATDWPLGTLGGGYLAAAHMVQFQLYTLAAAPLLMLGTPEWMVRRLVVRLHAHGALRILARPVVAGVGFNVILLSTHAPFTVDLLRTNQFGSFVLDMAWLVGGIWLWLPIISPLPELAHPSRAVRCVYLFLAAGALPMIPGGFLTFATYPLYAIYELAPRVNGISARSDQQVAGIIMNVGSVPVIWVVLLVIFVGWAGNEQGSFASLATPGEDRSLAAPSSGPQ